MLALSVQRHVNLTFPLIGGRERQTDRHRHRKGEEDKDRQRDRERQRQRGSADRFKVG